MQNYNVGILLKVCIASSLCAASLLASVGKITVVSGQVMIDRAGKSIEAKAGAEINQKDVLKSKGSSNAQLLFSDQTVITVGPNSTFSIEEYIIDDKNPSAKFKAGDGAFKAITGKIGKLAPDKFKVETKTATIGIRGTRLIIVSQGNQETYACTKGAITATPKTSPVSMPSGAGTQQTQPAQQQEQKTVVIQAGQVTTSTAGQISAPRPYTATELKQLEKTTDSGAKTSQQNEAPAGSQAQQQQTAATEQTQQQPISGTDTTKQQSQTSAIASLTSNIDSIKNDAVSDANQEKIDSIAEVQRIVLSQFSELTNYMTKDVGTTVTVSAATGTVSMVMSEFITPSYGSQKIWVSSDKKYVFAADSSRLDYLTYPSLAFMPDNRFTAGPYASYYPDAVTLTNPFEVIAVKSSYSATTVGSDIVQIKNASSDALLSSQGFSGFITVAGTFAEIATHIDAVLSNGAGYSVNVAKYEALDGQYKKWTRLPNGVFEEYTYSSAWIPTNNYLANHSTISGLDLSATAYKSFYIYGVPSAYQNLSGHLGMTDGGKWYFKYDSANPAYAGTIQVGASVPYTDAVKVSSYSDIPFMASKSASNAYPTFYKNDGSYNYVYTQRPTGDYYAPITSVNQYDVAVNVDYYNADGSVAAMLLPSSQKAMYVFQKLDSSGNILADSRNGTIVNPLTGNTVNIYANKMTKPASVYTYLSGPINNPAYDAQMLQPASGNTIMSTNGVLGAGYYDFSNIPTDATYFWKLAVEKARWNDKPMDDSIYVYADYKQGTIGMELTKPTYSSMYIKYPGSGDGVVLSSFMDVYFEKRISDNAIMKVLFDGGIMTGRVVANGDTNKISGKYFDLFNGVVTSDVFQNDHANGLYLFNENGQYVNSSTGGLDNVQSDNSSKYNWIAHELYSTSGIVESVDLMKKVASSATDTQLFTSIPGYNSTYGSTMSGFAIGADTNDDLWLGDIFSLNTKTMSGSLTMSTPTVSSAYLGISPFVDMSALSQADIGGSVASASFLKEDLQGMIIQNKTINGKTHDFALATLPDGITEASKYSFIDDYSSWGYWVARETDASSGCSLGASGCNKNIAMGYWVAGYETPAATISSLVSGNAAYSYTGNIIGSLNDNVAVHPIQLDGFNRLDMNVNFGSANPVQITNVQFSTTGGLYTVQSSTPSTASSISGNGFSSSTGWNSGTNFINTNGKFYGPSAESAGGAWSGSFNSGALNGVGVFKVRKVN